MTDKRRDQIDGLPTHAELIAELTDIMKAAGIDAEQRKQVLMGLVPLIVRRDHTIYNYAFTFAKRLTAKENTIQSK